LHPPSITLAPRDSQLILSFATQTRHDTLHSRLSDKRK
jgi:hypothetical protein